MDNSLKLLIGVLGLAGLLAFLVPTNVTAPASVPVAATVSSAPVLAAVATEAVDVQSSEEGDTEGEPEDEELFKFGEPTIDGKPFAGGDDDASDNSDNPDTQNDIGNSDEPMESTAVVSPRNSPDQPAPGTFLPLDQ